MLKIYNDKEFITRVHDIDEIILFGAGRRMETIEAFFFNTEVVDKVSMVVDNDINKHGTNIKLWGKEIKICDFCQITKKNLYHSLILITVEDYGSLLDDLLQTELLENVEIVCFSHITALQKEAKSMDKVLPKKIRMESCSLIPKKIHYCWFGGKELPDKYKRYMESWYKFCPDYEIIEWNESNYDVTKNKYMYDAYRENIWGFVPDFARIDIIHSHGGIYLDTDVELVKNLDDLLYQKGFMGFEDDEHVNLGSGFGAIKGLPIFRELMEDYNKIKFINEDGKLNLTASPIYNTILLSKHGLLNNGEYQIVEDVTIYPAKVLTGKSMYTMRTVIKPWTYAVHHYDGSWATERARKINARMEMDMKQY
ncbi:MAG: hypothetical protein HFG51_02985 [Lachnospiraceae bacterium]|nr:hypothetical protein [Lachnospiraceae bacterium]